MGFALSKEQPRCWRSPAFGHADDLVQRDILIQVVKYLPDHDRVFNTSNDVHGRTNAAGAGMRRRGDPDVSTAFTAAFDVDKVN